MRAKRDARALVQELRRQGLSYREILQRVPASKSSISLWCRNIELSQAQRQALLERKRASGERGLAMIAQLRQSGKLTRRRSIQPHIRRMIDTNGHEIERVKNLYINERLGVREVAERLGVGFWRVYELMRQHNIPRRRGSEQNYATYKTKPQFQLKSPLTSEEEQLRVAGAMLYWAEGAKTGHVVDFTNSDPQLITLFVAFLRKICGVGESRLRVLLYMYADQDMGRLKSFWLGITGIPLGQFVKPYVRQVTPNVSRRKMPWGLVHIRYADTRLLQLLRKWGQAFAQYWRDQGAGT